MSIIDSSSPIDVHIDVFISTKHQPEESHRFANASNIFTGTSTSGKTFARGGIRVISTSADPKDALLDPEFVFVRQALLLAEDDSYVIVCKDTAVAVATSRTIYDVIEKTIEHSSTSNANQFDIFYLANWADRCDLYTNERNVGERGLVIVNTVSPNGALCLMFSPEGRKKFLRVFKDGIPKDPAGSRSLGYHLHNRVGSRSNISKHPHNGTTIGERFYATTSSPTLLNFDMHNRTSDADFAKSAECRSVPPAEMGPSRVESSSSRMAFFWFVIVTIIVIAVAWLLIRLHTGCSVVTACTGDYCPMPGISPMAPVGTLGAEY